MPVRSGDFGRGGRFEKFILALQALSLDAFAATNQTDRVERMRAAAEELFGIDGTPQPVRPLAAPAESSARAGDRAEVERMERGNPDPAPVAPVTEPPRPLDDAPAMTDRPPIAPEAATSPAAMPAATEAGGPAPRGIAAPG